MSGVQLQFLANGESAERVIAQLEKKIAGLQNQLKHMSQESKRSTGFETSLANWAQKVGSLTVGYFGLGSAISHIIDQQKEMLRQADEAGQKYDVIFRRLRIQAGFTEMQSAKAQKRVEDIAIRNAVPVEVAAGAAEELVSQGFSAKDATGKALQTMLQTMKASAMDTREVDPRQLVQAAVMYLAAQGLERNDANLREQMVAIQQMFKKTALQLKDLEDLAGKTQASAGALTPAETLATFTVLREKNLPDVASTAFKIIIDRLQTIGARGTDIALLAQTGLKPEDVDLVGEDIKTVLDRLAKGLEGLPQEKQNIIMAGLFEERARAPATGLIRDRELIPQFIAEMKNEKSFMEDVQTGTEGRAAGRERAKAIRERTDVRKDADFYNMLEAADLLAQEKGVNKYRRWLNRSSSELSFATGHDMDTALNFGYGMTFSKGIFSQGDEAAGMIREKAKELEKPFAEQNKLIEDNNELLKQIEANTRRRAAPREREE